MNQRGNLMTHSIARTYRLISRLLIASVLLLGLASQAYAQTFPSRVGIGYAPNNRYIDLYYRLGTAITPIVFPAATGGTASVRYELSGGYASLGFAFDPVTRTLSGTPTLAGAGDDGDGFQMTYVKIGGGVQRITVYLTICEGGGSAAGTSRCTPPRYVSLSVSSLPDLTYFLGEPLSGQTLPEATGGTGTSPLRLYQAQPLPTGLSFNSDPDSLALSGTPTVVGETTVEYHVTDSASREQWLLNPLRRPTFTITVVPRLVAPAPNPMDLAYTAGLEILPVTLPAASGGTEPLTYTLTGPAGADLSEATGLAFDPATRVLSGTPTMGSTTTLTYTVADSGSQSLPTTFTVTTTGPAFASEPTDQSHVVGTTIADLTLPEATGIIPLTYTLTGPDGAALPAGLAFNADTRVLSGIPTEIGSTELTYAATDSAITAVTSTSTFTFAVTGPMLTAPADQTGSAGTAITDLTLPETDGGNLPITYTLTGPAGAALPDGLAFDVDNRVLSGTPTMGSVTLLTYTATDASGNSDTATFSVTVTGPVFASIFEDQSVAAGTAITADLTLPLASGGTDPFIYTLTGPDGTTLPPGVTFVAETRTLGGTPTLAGDTELTYTATDPHGNSVTDTFFVTITGPMFTDQPDLTYAAGEAITDLTLPEATGASPIIYTLTGGLPAGLAFDVDTRILSGTPTRATDDSGIELTYTATDTHDNMAQGTFILTITGPMFATTPDDETYTVGEAITDLDLPEATGVTPFTYALTGLPAGLAFNVDSRVLSGTPTRVGDTELTYIATDDHGNPVTTRFTVTVNPAPSFESPPTDLTVTANALITPLTLPEASGGTGALTYTLTGPAGAALPGRLIFAGRALSGTPTEVATTTLTYTVTDTQDATSSTTFDAVVIAEPMFRSAQPDITLTADVPFLDITLPSVASGGTPIPIPYTLTGPNKDALPDGLTFTAATRILSGTPTTAGTTELTYTFTDEHGTIEQTFRLMVTDEPSFPMTQDDLTFTVNLPLTLPLPVAASSDTEATYALTGPGGGALPPRLDFNVDTRVLSGTPSTVGVTELTYTVTDKFGATTLTFSVTIEGPVFAAQVADQTWPVDMEIADLMLPNASGGTGTVTYTLTGPDDGTLPDGLEFDADTRVLSGTPTLAGITELTYTVTNDANPPTVVTQTFTVTITSPAFAELVADQAYTRLTEITDLTLPQASGGTGAVTYTLTGPAASALPARLAFNVDTRVLSGTPTTAGTTELTYIATDEGDTRLGSLSFTVTVMPEPAFAAGTTIADQTYSEGQAIDVLTLPAASGGTGPLTYTFTNEFRDGVLGIPPGLIFDLSTRTLSGAPYASAGPQHMSYRAVDQNGAESLARPFTITILNKPCISELVDDQTYATGVAIIDLTPMPEVGGGTAPITYTLTGPNGDALPAGLTFTAATRILSGNPSVEGTTVLTYTATDANMDTASLTFSVTVTAAPFFMEMVANQGYIVDADITDLTPLPEVGGGTGAVTYTLTGPNGGALPTGLMFTAATRVLFGSPSVKGTTELTYTATDSAVPAAATVIQTFSITVRTTGENNPPMAVGEAVDEAIEFVLEPNTLKDVDLSPYITDPDGDSLTYTATSGNPSVEVVRVKGSVLRLRIGSSETQGILVKVTAADIFGEEIEFLLGIIIRLPTTQQLALHDVNLDTAAGAQIYRDLNDGNDNLFDHYQQKRTDNQLIQQVLRFEVSSGNSRIVSAELEYDTISNSPPDLTLTPHRAGTAIITVSAFDQFGTPTNPASATFTATVTGTATSASSTSKQERDLQGASIAHLVEVITARSIDIITSRMKRPYNRAGKTELLTSFNGKEMQITKESIAKAVEGDMPGLNMLDSLCGFSDMRDGEELDCNTSWKTALTKSSFSYTDSSSADTNFALWGEGDIGGFSADLKGGASYDGDYNAFHLGLDYQTSSSLKGVMLSVIDSEIDYKLRGEGKSTLDIDANNITPYIQWKQEDGVNLWAMFALGNGDVKLSGNDRTGDSDLKTRALAFGIDNTFKRKSKTGAVTTWKGDFNYSRTEVDEDGDIAELDSKNWRVRFALDMAFEKLLARGKLSKHFEIGARVDGGDRQDILSDDSIGSGLEVAVGAKYIGNNGTKVELFAKSLIAHSNGGLDEHNISLNLSHASNNGQRGLQLSLHPVWGKSIDKDTWLSENLLKDTDGKDNSDSGLSFKPDSVAFRMGYNLHFPRIAGLFKPYGELNSSGNNRTNKIGLGFTSSREPIELEVFNEQKDSASDKESIWILQGRYGF